MAKDSKERPALTPREFSEKFGMSLNVVLRLLSEGQIPAIRLGHRWFIPKAALAEWLATAGRSVADS